MEKRTSSQLDSKYGPYAPVELFEINRADSIEWACAKFLEGGAVARRLSELKTQFRNQLQKNFPRETILLAVIDDDDPNHFLVMLGQICDMNHSASMRGLGKFFCELLKSELNLDLHPSASYRG